MQAAKPLDQGHEDHNQETRASYDRPVRLRGRVARSHTVRAGPG